MSADMASADSHRNGSSSPSSERNVQSTNGHASMKDSASADKENTKNRSRSRSVQKDRRPREKEQKDRDGKRRRSKERSKKSRSRSKSKDRKRSKSRERDRDRRRKSRSRSRDRRRRSRSRDTQRGRRDNARRSRSRDGGRRKDRSRDRRPKRSRSRDRDNYNHHGNNNNNNNRRRRSRSPRNRRRSISRSPIRGRGLSPFQRKGGEDMSTEERDLRTVFCMQLSQRIRARDLEDFFSAVGKVRDVRMIVDNKTRKSKGIAYVEFFDLESVPLAMGLNGQKLFNVPIIVQPTQAERNRQANQTAASTKGPMRLYVGSLHFDISEQMLKEIFEPFGRLDRVELIKEEGGKSKGYGFVTFHEADAAKKAMEQLNGFELAGRPMKVGNVTERGMDGSAPSILDNEELDRTGIELGAHGRLALMAKLAEGTGIQLPDAAKTALQQMQSAPSFGQANNVQQESIATQCFLLSNMFDAAEAHQEKDWDLELREDVLQECRKHGGAVHCFVDKEAANVYVKCPSIATAVAAVGVLHGRFFAGRVITAAYVPVMTYHHLFPDAVSAKTLL